MRAVLRCWRPNVLGVVSGRVILLHTRGCAAVENNARMKNEEQHTTTQSTAATTHDEDKKDGVGDQTQHELKDNKDNNDNELDNVANALSFLKLSPQDHLNQLERAICPKCLKKRKYFCYNCMLPMGDPALAPRLSLPLKCDVIHHPTELLSKSTAIHARVICPDDVKIYEFPDIPDYNLEETVLLFPSDTATNLRDLDMKNIKKVVFVDSQWQKTKRMMNDPRLARLNCVKIELQKTFFWRSKGDECLATIEAIYYFFKEYHQKTHNGEYNGEVDNMLYYYSLFYGLIQDVYKKGQKEFPRIDNYIKTT